MAQLLADLGVERLHSRPHVSNDNPFSESHFATVKGHPEFPDRFASFEHAHELMLELVSVGALSPSRALGTARRIRENNPHHISEAILERFGSRLARIK